MNWSETLEFLFSSLPMYQRIGAAAYKADLKNSLELDCLTGNPHLSFKTIHVAGTNGKGSTSHMLASVFQENGYRTGLYTSPHLVDFRERIRINGSMIDQNYVIHFVEAYKSDFERIKPSFFEMTVALAFSYFRDSSVDIAIIETGMGGRLDSTNIITPILSVITNIGLDHTAFLGDTHALIAAEKAGIIKKGIPVVIGNTNVDTSVIFNQVSQMNRSEIYHASDYFKVNRTNNYTYDVSNLRTKNESVIVCPLDGYYQQENIGTVLTCCEVLKQKGLQIDHTLILQGIDKVIAHTGLRGRWEKLSDNPLIICDTGHNEDGFKQLIPQIRQISCRRLFMILGFVGDKSIEPILELLKDLPATFIFTRSENPRSLSGKALEDVAKTHNMNGLSFESVKDAYNYVLSIANSNDFIFVGGSTFIVADLLLYVLNNKNQIV
jgi:dihydrofolate synthase/folylpolyglutamate synthase